MRTGWKSIEGYEGLYEISESGDVFNLRTGKCAGVSESGRRSEIVTLIDKFGNHSVYNRKTLFLKAFNPDLLGYHTVFIDGNRDHYSVDNIAVKIDSYGKPIKSVNKVKCIETGEVYRSVKELSRRSSSESDVSYHIKKCILNNKPYKGFHYAYVD